MYMPLRSLGLVSLCLRSVLKHSFLQSQWLILLSIYLAIGLCVHNTTDMYYSLVGLWLRLLVV